MMFIVLYSAYIIDYTVASFQMSFSTFTGFIDFLVTYLKFSFLNFLRNYCFGRYGMGPQESASEQLNPMSNNLRKTILNDVFD